MFTKNKKSEPMADRRFLRLCENPQLEGKLGQPPPQRVVTKKQPWSGCF
jgi:hypothetical protein